MSFCASGVAGVCGVVFASYTARVLTDCSHASHPPRPPPSDAQSAAPAAAQRMDPVPLGQAARDCRVAANWSAPAAGRDLQDYIADVVCRGARDQGHVRGARRGEKGRARCALSRLQVCADEEGGQGPLAACPAPGEGGAACCRAQPRQAPQGQGPRRR